MYTKMHSTRYYVVDNVIVIRNRLINPNTNYIDFFHRQFSKLMFIEDVVYVRYCDSAIPHLIYS